MEENKNNEASLKALEKMQNDVKGLNDGGILLTDQWHIIDRSELAYGGEYYETDIVFKVQSASTHTIKYFSSIDEENPMVVQDGIQKIIENHVLVLKGNKRLDSYSVIHNFDRLKFVLLVALYTGTGNELKCDVVCKGDVGKPCNHKQTVKVNPSSLVYSEPSQKAKELYNSKIGMFVINTKTMGEFRYKPLSLSEDMEVSQFAMKKYNDGDQIDKLFIDFAGFYMWKKTPQMTMDDVYLMYMKETSDIKVISLFQNIIEKDIILEQKMELVSTCEKCGRLGKSGIVSIDNLRHIFLVSNINEEY